MKDRPILFSAPMVRAILAGEKTQTRRIVKPQPELWTQTGGYHYPLDKKPYRGAPIGRVPTIDHYRCPHGQPGDRLWVRETWCECDGDTGRVVAFRADEWHECPADDGRWRPSIFMPRRYSRITLEITGVRVECVQDISAADKEAEGLCASQGYGPAAFEALWNDINAKRGYGWGINPWVWAITFKRAL